MESKNKMEIMESGANKRVSHIDAVSGLLIIYMIIIHVIQFSKFTTALRLLYPLSFFMSWFFFKSGMFYKDKTHKKILTGGVNY